MKNFLGVCGATLCLSLAAGCQTDAAEEAAPESKPAEAVTAPVTNVPAGPATVANQAVATPIQTNDGAPNLTNAATLVSTNGTNTAEITIVKTIPPAPPENLKMSKAAQEVVRLAQSGVSDAVILLFVEKAADKFNLDADDIVYMNDIGVSSDVVAAMLAHDGVSPDVQNALTNKIDVADAPTAPATNSLSGQPGPVQYQVSSNYIANGSQPAAVYDPNAVAAAPQPVTVVQQTPTIVVQQPVVVEDPAVSYSYFYSSLSPYGSWAYITDYGWCWQPTIAVSYAGWRPYAHGGRWLYSDAGWYWQSSYSWGWAPFHYGRWFCAPRVGWVWTPDYTWGPSWVTWRRAGDYCGWAPLPPHSYVRPGVGFTYWDHNVGFSFNFGLGHDHFTFVPARHFTDHHPIRHVVPTERTSNIYRNSTVVNNYIVGNNNTVINNGISRDYVASHTRSEIPKVSVREEPRAGRTIPADRVQRAGNELVVYRPTAPSVRAEAAVRERQESLIRPRVSGTSPSSGLAVTPSRPGTSSTTASRSEIERRNITTSGTRSEAVRPQVARTETPVFARPQPIRPEPEKPVMRAPLTAQSTPAVNQRISPQTPLISSRPATSGSISGRQEAFNTPSRSVTPNVSPTVRPSYGAVDNRPVAAPSTPSNLGARPSIGSSTPGIPPHNEVARNNVQTPTVSQPAQILNPQTPVNRPSLNNRPSVNTTPNNNTTTIPRYTPQPGASVAPQPIRPNNAYPVNNNWQASPPPSTSVGRSESFGNSRPSVSAVERPQISTPSISTPTPSLPQRIESPRSVAPSPPAGGGQVRSTPPQGAQVRPAPSAPASAPQQSHQNSGNRSENRGRLEIGR
jgi:hypothetical protein